MLGAGGPCQMTVLEEAGEALHRRSDRSLKEPARRGRIHLRLRVEPLGQPEASFGQHRSERGIRKLAKELCPVL